MRALLILSSLILNGCVFYTVDPGSRGVKVTLGSVDTEIKQEGFGFKLPLVSTVTEVSIKQQTAHLKTDVYSKDNQQAKFSLTVTYRVPEQSVLKVFKDFAGNPETDLIVPRVCESLKQTVNKLSATDMIQQREQVKINATEKAKKEMGDLVQIESIVIDNIDLSEPLEKAIEAKMVQEQEAEKAKFTKQKAQIDAERLIIEANGEAQALSIRGKAFRENPDVLKMELIKKWNGVSPTVIGPASGTGIILPMHEKSEK